MSTNGPTYKQQATTLVGEMMKHLKGRGQSFTYEVNLDHGAPLFGKPYTNGPTKFTTAQVIDAVNRFIVIPRNSKGEPHSTLSGFISDDGTTGEITGRMAGALALAQTNRNGNLVVVSGFTQGPRHDTPKRHAMAAFKAAQSDAVVWTVDGLDRVFASKADAIAFGVRAVFAEDWKDANSIEDQEVAQAERNKLKAALVLRKDGVVVESKAKAPKATEAPTVTLSAAQAKAMASAMGGKGADVKTKAAAVAYLQSLGIGGL